MADYDDEYEEYYDDAGGLSEEDIELIQAAYRAQKLKENLIGPIISTAVHVSLLLFCAVFFVGETVTKNETVEITPIQE